MPAESTSLGSCRILEMRMDATSYKDAPQRVLEWVREGESRYVCVAVVHTVMGTHDEAEFRRIVNAADLVNREGMDLLTAVLFRTES